MLPAYCMGIEDSKLVLNLSFTDHGNVLTCPVVDLNTAVSGTLFRSAQQKSGSSPVRSKNEHSAKTAA